MHGENISRERDVVLTLPSVHSQPTNSAILLGQYVDFIIFTQLESQVGPSTSAEYAVAHCRFMAVIKQFNSEYFGRRPRFKRSGISKEDVTSYDVTKDVLSNQLRQMLAAIDKTAGNPSFHSLDEMQMSPARVLCRRRGNRAS